MRVYKEKSIFEQISELRKEYIVRTGEEPDTIELDRQEYEEVIRDIYFKHTVVPFEKINHLNKDVTIFGMVVKPIK